MTYLLAPSQTVAEGTAKGRGKGAKTGTGRDLHAVPDFVIWRAVIHGALRLDRRRLDSATAS